MFGHSFIDQEWALGSYNRPIGLMRGTFNWANRFLDQRLHLIGELGIGGERVRDWLRRISPTLASMRPGIVIVSDPINDLANVTNPGYVPDPRQTDLTYVIEGYSQVIEYVTDVLDAYCVILGCLPPKPAASNLLGARVAAWNRWAMNQTAENRRVRFSPVHESLIDPTSTAGLVKEHNTGTAVGFYDTIHPNTLASYARGKVLAQTLSKFEMLPEFSRLIYTVGETIANNGRTVTSFSAANGRATIVLDNSLLEIRPGDICTFWSVSAPELNGGYRTLSSSTTQLVVECGKTGSVSSGVMQASGCLQVLGNPLFLSTTGGTKTGVGAARILGGVPNLMSISCSTASAGCTVNVATAAHTDRNNAGDGFGNWLELDITTDVAADIVVSMFGSRGALTASPVFGRIADGEVVSALVEGEVVGGAGGVGNPSGLGMVNAQINLSFTPPGEGTQNVQLHELFRSTLMLGDSFPQERWRGVMCVPEYRLPRGAVIDLVDVAFTVSFSGAGAAKVRIARASLHKVPPELSIRGGEVDSAFATQ